MRNLRRAIATSLLVLAFVWSVPAPATAAADNAAVVTNTENDSYRWRQAFKITRVNGDTIDQSNGAVASASCERCRTVAVAFQVVLGTGDASTVVPENLAIAFNQNCSLCATYAGAFQYVVTPRTQVHFTEKGDAEIDRIKADLQALIAGATFGPTESGDDPHDLTEIQAFDAQVSALFSQLKSVVDAELVRAGGGKTDQNVDVDLAA
jgi:hypothetical protein